MSPGLCVFGAEAVGPNQLCDPGAVCRPGMAPYPVPLAPRDLDGTYFLCTGHLLPSGVAKLSPSAWRAQGWVLPGFPRQPHACRPLPEPVAM